jgi:hypothetical protein
MSRLVEFGEPAEAEWDQQTLADVAGVLYTLLDREVDRANRVGAKLYGKGRVNRRIDMIQGAYDLVEKAQAL